jgi:hypothetical protein
MKDLGLMAVGILVFVLICTGAIIAGSETSDGSNTRNAVVVGPPLPEGVRATVNRVPDDK